MKINIEHDGLTFTDSDELGTYLNMSENTLIALLNQGQTIGEIAEHNKLLWPIAERRRLKQKPPTTQSGHCRPCTIQGVVYPSQAAAARKYHIPLQTIYSRMQRQGLSFEQAVLRGYREEHLLNPTQELYAAFSSVLQSAEQLSVSSLSDFKDVLEAAGFSCSTLQSEDGGVQAIKTSFELQDTVSVEIWLIYLRERELLETVIPKLPLSPADVNHLNGCTASIRFWVGQDGNVQASTCERFKTSGEGAKYALRSFYQFLGACCMAIEKQSGR